jgi:hypothetical protein
MAFNKFLKIIYENRILFMKETSKLLSKLGPKIINPILEYCGFDLEDEKFAQTPELWKKIHAKHLSDDDLFKNFDFDKSQKMMMLMGAL